MKKRKGDTASKLANRIAKNEWQKLVKARAGYKCEICGRSGQQFNLDAHHICRKSSNFMKTLIDNGICLCSMNCHFNGVHSPDWETQRDFNNKILEVVGEERMEKLIFFKHNSPKITYEDLYYIREQLKDQLNDYIT